MIDFHYTIQGEEIVITLKTNITEIGTFHRMAAVIYGLDWDILSGDIQTIEEDGQKYSLDILKLRADPKNTKKAAELGILMEGILRSNVTIQEFLKDQNITLREPRKFFQERAELIFQDDPEKNATIFYVEADSGKGLLYYLTRVLVEYQIDIIGGTIETNLHTGRAEDTFFLLDKDGNLFGETPKAEEIRKKIINHL